MPYIVALYEIDRKFGGPEEGGWWYDTGHLRRIIATAKSITTAHAKALRANALLDKLQRNKRPVESSIYEGGRHIACVYHNLPPQHFPETRPVWS